MSANKEREDFEAWARSERLPVFREGEGYAWHDVNLRWEGWQARTTLPSTSTDGAQAGFVLVPAAWQHATDSARVISASQKKQAERDGGASASSVRPYITPLYAAAYPKEHP